MFINQLLRLCWIVQIILRMYIEVQRIESHQMLGKYGLGLDSYLYKMVIVSINHKEDANLLQSVSNYCFRRQLTLWILCNYHHDTFMPIKVITPTPYMVRVASDSTTSHDSQTQTHKGKRRVSFIWSDSMIPQFLQFWWNTIICKSIY